MRSVGSAWPRWFARGWLALFLIALTVPASFAQQPSAEEDAKIAQSLAEMLRDARAIISNNQSRINDPEIGDKGLTAKVVLDQAVETYKKNTGVDPVTIDPASRHGRLLRAMMAVIAEVMDANQSTINAKGIGFKAFIPAVFGRMVAESFARLANGDAELKVTAPPELVRNRKARPDSFEEKIIKTKLLEPAWPRGQPYSEMADAKGRPAYRVMVPEYYAASCLSCHGVPKGEMDITGYPKEGAKQDDLGGVISITLYR
jgi:archaellum component FlaG (FlaF/FlaG flagellin family)